MRLPLFSDSFAEAITAADRAHPVVQRKLRQSLRETISFAVLSMVPTSLVFAAILWPYASRRGLCMFVALVWLNGLQHWFTHLRQPVDRDRTKQVAFAQLIGGTVWGTLPVLAMPQAAQWQVLIGALLIGVYASNVFFASQFISSSLSFTLGLSALAIPTFLLLQTSTGNAVAVLLSLAAAFSTGMSFIIRARDVAASVFGVRSAELAEGLRIERELLAKRVHTDQLTGLPNRSALLFQLEKALDPLQVSSDTRVGLAYLDIDGFKRVNDSLGHRAGDLLLRAAAERLTAVLRPGELAARLAGDELTVLVPELPESATARNVGERLLQAFSSPFELDGYSIDVHASVGIALGESGTSPDDLLKHADTALYRAKAAGGSQVVVFDAALREETERVDELEASFGDALWQGQVVPYLQPFVELDSGRIVGAEALIRWVDGDVVRSAHAFMPVVHKLNIGAQVDASVLAQIIDFNLAVERELGQLLPISINVSPNHIEQFLDRVNPDHLASVLIEVTEESMFPTLAHLDRVVGRIRAMGGRVILDDFGVGYSSLQRLSATPVDGLKIDRQFVAALDTTAADEAIVASIVELARRMQLLLVAEGIETAAQVSKLRGLGVTEGQGYLYSAAVPLDDFMDMLRDDVRLGPAAVRHEQMSPNPAV